MASEGTDGRFENMLSRAVNFDPTIIGAIVAVVVIIVTIFILILRSRKPKRKTILLAGISDGGKTLLFSKLVFSKNIESYTSIKENSGLFWVKSKRVDIPIIDIPGNERQRVQFWDRFKSQTRGLVYIIDSSTIQKEIKEVAEYLYTLLTDAGFPKSKSYLLIACNKQDITMAKSSRVIQSQLEKEMNTLRVTRAATLDSTESSGKSREVFLGKKGKSFEFAHLSPLKVEFVECSSKGSGEDEEGDHPIVEWINKVTK